MLVELTEGKTQHDRVRVEGLFQNRGNKPDRSEGTAREREEQALTWKDLDMSENSEFS